MTCIHYDFRSRDLLWLRGLCRNVLFYAALVICAELHFYMAAKILVLVNQMWILVCISFGLFGRGLCVVRCTLKVCK